MNVELPRVHTSNSLLYLAELATAGAGIALLPCFMCAHYIGMGQPRLLLPEAHRPPTTIGS